MSQNQPAVDRPLPGIEGLTLALRWAEDMLTTISGPLIQVGLGLSVIDTLSNGQFAANWPQLTMVYSIALTIGIDGQLVGSAFRLGRNVKHKVWAGAWAEAAIVVILAYITFVGGWAAGYKETFNTSTTAALASLGFDKLTWLAQRIGVAVLLAILSGVRRYVEPKPEKTAAEIKAELDRKAAIAKARANYAATTGRAWLNAAKATVTGQAEQDEDTEAEAEPPPDDPHITSISAARGKRKSRSKKRSTRTTTPPDVARRLIAEYLRTNPQASNNEIAKATKLSTSTVSKYKALAAQAV